MKYSLLDSLLASLIHFLSTFLLFLFALFLILLFFLPLKSLFLKSQSSSRMYLCHKPFPNSSNSLQIFSVQGMSIFEKVFMYFASHFSQSFFFSCLMISPMIVLILMQARLSDSLRRSRIIGIDSMKLRFCDETEGWVMESNHSLTEFRLKLLGIIILTVDRRDHFPSETLYLLRISYPRMRSLTFCQFLRKVFLKVLTRRVFFKLLKIFLGQMSPGGFLNVANANESGVNMCMKGSISMEMRALFPISLSGLDSLTRLGSTFMRGSRDLERKEKFISLAQIGPNQRWAVGKDYLQKSVYLDL